MKLGLIGLDTSHVIRFTEILNNPANKYHIQDARIIAAYPGGSPDIFLSHSRLDKFTSEVRDKHGAAILESPEAVANACDAILITSVDGRVHFSQFEKVVAAGKPVFIDKPFATSLRDAEAMFELADRYRVPLMSCSSLRYAGALTEGLIKDDKGALIGADCYGPMELEETNPGFFWYGIHAAEMLFSILGKGCKKVTVATNADHDMAVGEWKDGRIGTVRGNRRGNDWFGALLHREKGTDFIDVEAHPVPYYYLLLEQVIQMFKTGTSPIDPQETLDIIRFIEAANKSRATGESVTL